LLNLSVRFNYIYMLHGLVPISFTQYYRTCYFNRYFIHLIHLRCKYDRVCEIKDEVERFVGRFINTYCSQRNIFQTSETEKSLDNFSKKKKMTTFFSIFFFQASWTNLNHPMIMFHVLFFEHFLLLFKLKKKKKKKCFYSSNNNFFQM
jgi:hypothetical protein